MTNVDYNFDSEEEISGAGQSIKMFKPGDVFVGFIQSVEDYPKQTVAQDSFGNDDYGNRVYNVVALGDKNVDHKSDDGTASGQPVPNEIIEGEVYQIHANYKSLKQPGQPPKIKYPWGKLTNLPMGAIFQAKFIKKEKAPGSKFSHKVIEIKAKRNKDNSFMIHPDYKAPEDFSNEEPDGLDEF